MKPARFAIVVLVVSALWMSVPRASTQEPQSPPQRPSAQSPATEPTPRTAAEVQVLFDAMVVVQAQSALSLTDAQYPQFVGRLKALQDARRRNQRARNQIIQDLARLTNPNNAAPDESQLRDKLKGLDDLEGKAAAEIRKAYENLDQVLAVRQRARFRVFEEQVERRKFQFLLNARRGQTQEMKPPAAR